MFECSGCCKVVLKGCLRIRRGLIVLRGEMGAPEVAEAPEPSGAVEVSRGAVGEVASEGGL